MMAYDKISDAIRTRHTPTKTKTKNEATKKTKTLYETTNIYEYKKKTKYISTKEQTNSAKHFNIF